MSIPAVTPQPNFQNKFPTDKNYHFELKASVLENTLVKFKERFGLPHHLISEKDIDEKMGQVIRNKAIDDHTRKKWLNSLIREKDKMLELVAAYKYNSQAERNAKSSEQQLAKAEAAESGWIQLYLALNHLTKVSASYYKGNEATQNLRELEGQVKASTKTISALKTRKQVLAEKSERLIQYYRMQADLSAAEAMAGLIEHAKEFQSAQI